MRFLSAITLAAYAAATADPNEILHISSYPLAAGTGVQSKVSSSTKATVSISSNNGAGILTLTQTIQILQPTTDNVVSSWVALSGAADNGNDVYAFAFGTSGPYITQDQLIAPSSGCGTAQSTLGGAGYSSDLKGFTKSQCSLKIQKNEIKYIGNQTFKQTVMVSVTDQTQKQDVSSLKRGAWMEARSGVLLYPNPGSDRPILDTYTGTAGFYLNGATTTLAGAGLAAILLMSF